MIDGWSLGIGDPTLLGWITTIAYMLATWLCGRAFAATPLGHEAAAARRFWLILAVAMAALTINKQLDLQVLLTTLGRRLAHDEGWYDARRTVQRIFIIAIALTVALVLGFLLLHLHHATGWARLAGVGLTFIAAFVLVRAASFHHMDLVIHAQRVSVTVDHLLELSGIALIAVGAVGDRRQRRAFNR